MTEHQKMVSGEFYDPRDPAILQEYHRARRLLRELAQCDSHDPLARNALLRELLGGFAEGAWIELPFLCEYGSRIRVGRNTFINMNCVFLDAAPIEIGDNTLIGPNCQFYTPTHPLPAHERIRPAGAGTDGAPYRTRTRPIRIGHNVWLGGSVIVLPGVSIGDNTTVGAGSVVTRDLPAGVVAAGNPARILRTLEEPAGRG